VKSTWEVLERGRCWGKVVGVDLAEELLLVCMGVFVLALPVVEDE